MMLPAIEFSMAITPPPVFFLLDASLIKSTKLAHGRIATSFPKNIRAAT